MILTLKVSEDKQYEYIFDDSTYAFSTRGMNILDNTGNFKNSLSLQIMLLKESNSVENRAILYNIYRDSMKITQVDNVILSADNGIPLFNSNDFGLKCKGFNFSDQVNDMGSITSGCNFDILFDYKENV